MRRIIAGLMVVLTVLSLCGCGNTDAPPKGSEEEGTPQVSDRPAAPSEQPTETESQTPSVPESLFLQFFEDELTEYDERYGCTSVSKHFTREPDESTHQETVVLTLTMGFEYFKTIHEASIVYQYYSSDDIWKPLNLDSYQRPQWSTVYEELNWDKMIGIWADSGKYFQYMIRIDSIDPESMTFTCSYDVTDSWLSTYHYSGSGTFEFSRHNGSSDCSVKIRPDEKRLWEFKVLFDQNGVTLYSLH